MFIEKATSKFFSEMLTHWSKKVTAIILLVLPVARAPGQVDDQQVRPEYDRRALSHYLDGEQYMFQQEYGRAAEEYRRVLQYDSSSASVYLALAEALLRSGELESAREAGESGLARGPDDPLALDILSQIHVQRKEVGQALAYLDRWLALEQRAVEPLFRKGGLLIAEKRFAEAVDTYVAIFDRDPSQRQVLARAGEIALTLRDYERAYQVYERWRRSAPDDPKVARRFAELALQTRRLEEAREAYEYLNLSGTADLNTTVRLGGLYMQLKDFSRARDLFSPLIGAGRTDWELLRLAGILAIETRDFGRLVRLSDLMRQAHPDSVDGYTNLAVAKANLDDEEGAVEVLAEVRSRFRADPGFNYILGNLYYRLGRFDAAEEPLVLAHKKMTDSRSLGHLLASTWSSLGKYAPSDSLFEELMASDEDDATVLNNYAYSIAERPQVSRSKLRYAKKLSKRSLKKQPENAAYLDTYGWISFRLKRYRTARRYIEQSVQHNGNSAVVLEHLGEVYQRLGKAERAEEFFKRARERRSRGTSSQIKPAKD